MMETVEVELGDRTYPIHIGEGLLERAGTFIASLRPGARCAIVTDANVNRLHGDMLRQTLSQENIDHVTITVMPGETSKSFSVLTDVTGAILDARLERSDLVIAFGGGVVGDLAGFAAAITRRGMDFVQIPTSLLAQVDSSVGGKTGINTMHGKNLVGAFHQPALVLADTALLKTLPEREFRAGYAEVAKYGLIDQPDFFVWLEENLQPIFSHGPELGEAIARSCRSKAAIIAADETEAGRRALLNLGHTYGHALEGFTGYDGNRLVHGEAVSIGLALAHQFSNRMNLCDADTPARVVAHLEAAGLPCRIGDIPGNRPDAATLCGFIAQDKKVRRGKLTFILTRGLGRAYIADDIPPDEVLAFLENRLGQ